MKITIHLENADKLKKEKWRTDDTDYSGAQGKTTKWVKENKEGIRTTLFNKSAVADTDEIFEPTKQLTMLLSELSARDIIEAANKAGKVYGFPATLFPIPHQFEWSIEVIKRKHLKVNILSSAFNDIKRTSDYDLKMNKYDDLILAKMLPINLLIGNGDLHKGNRIYKEGNKSAFYLIDFGLAFNDVFLKDEMAKDIKSIKDLIGKKLANNTDQKSDRVRKKMAEFYNFFEMFIEHNESYMLKTLDQNYNKIGKAIAKAFKNPSEDEEEKILTHLNMLEKAKDGKKKVLKRSIDACLKLCKEVQEILK